MTVQPVRCEKAIQNVCGEHGTDLFLIELSQTVSRCKDKIFSVWFDENGKETSSYTFLGLWEEAGYIAHKLRNGWKLQKGDKIILCYNFGFQFFAAFLGCLRAGVTAVLVYPPSPAKMEISLSKLAKIIANSEPKFVLVDADVNLLRKFSFFKSSQSWPKIEYKVHPKVKPLDKDGKPFKIFFDKSIVPNDLAFLQYTSGSTGEPKGVMVTFGAIRANISTILGDFQDTLKGEKINIETLNYFTWLPLYHDMGLIMSTVAFAAGWRCNAISPMTFIKKPLLWIELMSRLKVHWSIVPDFGFKLAARKFKEEKKKLGKEPIVNLDLSSILYLISGAEPIRLGTVKLFENTFCDYGLRKEWFCGAYGMAEMVAYISQINELKLSTFQPSPGTSLIAVGKRNRLIDKTQDICIVDSKTCRKLRDGKVGEIWVSGSSVTAGYFRKPQLNKEVFNVPLHGSNNTYLRTGDLGIFEDDYLYICGREKDLIIVNGVNYYPQDIENVAFSIAGVRPGCAAAFSSNDMNADGELEVVFEVREIANNIVEKVTVDVHHAITKTIGLVPSRVVAIKERTILKTTSGKIERKANRNALHNNLYIILHEHHHDVPCLQKKISKESDKISTSSPNITYEETLHLVRKVLGDFLNTPIDQIPTDRPLAEFGLTSIQAVELTKEFEEQTSIELPATFLYEAPTVAAIVEAIVSISNASESPKIGPIFHSGDHKAIAVVGMSCRLPGGICDLEKFWNLLDKADDAVKEIPKSRIDIAPYYDSSGIKSGKSITKWAGMLHVDEIDMFDPLHFSMSPREARCLDPRGRLLLECTWEAFEAAGYKSSDYKGSKTGVFMGMTGSEFEMGALRSHSKGVDPSSILGSNTSSLVGRISYTYDLHGPNLVIDTACSSSLTSVHQACRSLQAGDCDMALAGGVNLTLTPEVFVDLSQTGALSPNGKCCTFGSRADGYVRAEGCGIILLKPLHKALQDNDNIRAVIRGGALNQDGLSQGLTAPNGEAQKQVILSALADARVSPEDIDYIECHGTGTPLGDPIEVNALAHTLTKIRDQERNSRKLVIGSVKSNIGHTEVAAGVIGLIKTILCLQHEVIAPTLHCTPLNPHIDVSKLNMKVASSHIAWPKCERKRLAGVSSFGFSGTNVHMIIEEAPVPETSTKESSSSHTCLPFILSARTNKALKSSAQRLLKFILGHPDVSIERLAYTLATKREFFTEHQVSFVASSTSKLQENLEQLSIGNIPIGCARIQGAPNAVSSHKVCMMFTGQGSQYAGMGREMYRNFTVFKLAVDKCCEIFDNYLKKPLLTIMFSSEGTVESDLLNETYYSQPAIFTLEYALYSLWISFGVVPDVLIGHSVGELVAAAVGGVFTLSDICRIVFIRSSLMNDLPYDGSMVAVYATEVEITLLITPWKEEIDVAAVNHLNQVVLSGHTEVIDSVIKVMESRGIKAKKLNVKQAFHSHHLDPVLDKFGKSLDSLTLNNSAVPFISCSRISKNINQSSYWVKQMRDPVFFSDGIAKAISDDVTIFLEVGPGTTLCELVKLNATSKNLKPVLIPSLLPSTGEVQSFTKNLIKMRGIGVSVGLENYFEGKYYDILDIPHYPFDRQCFNINLRQKNQREIAKIRKGDKRNTASRYYDDLVEHLDRPSEEVEYITFGIFEEFQPNFSWVLAFNDPDYRELVKKKVFDSQEKLRDVAFRHVDFSSICSVLDIGCGVGTDLIQLSQKHVHLKLDGFTISAAQAKVAMNRAEKLNLNNRVKFLHADSSVDPFPSTYDLGIGFEVVHHIENKEALFSNLSKSIKESGYLVFADFIAPSGGINHDLTSSYFLDSSGWSNILSTHGFKLIDIIDISQEVSNFLKDPSFDLSKEPYAKFASTADIINAYESYHNLGMALGKGLIRYVLLTAKKDTSSDAIILEDINSQLLDEAILYKSFSSPKYFYTRKWIENPISNDISANASINYRSVKIQFKNVPGFEVEDLSICQKHVEISSSNAQDLVEENNFAAILLLGKSQIDLRKFMISFLHTIQSLLKSTNQMKKILIVTKGADGPDGTMKLEGKYNLILSAIWGLVRSVRLEVKARIICIDTDAMGGEELSSQLMHEVHNESCDEVVYRRGKRFIPVLVEKLCNMPNSRTNKVSGCANGVFIITGGLGGLGILTAETLAELGARVLVLVSRESKVKLQVQDLKARLKKIENTTSTKISIETCDISLESRVESLLGRVRHAYGSIDGVVHSAGVISDRSFFQQDENNFDLAFEGKANGAWLLHKHTLGDSLKYFISFSSLVALFGNVGQTNYAAANTFLDALVRYRRAINQPGISIQWPPIIGVGMAANRTFKGQISKTCIGPNAVKATLLRLFLDTHCQDPVQAVVDKKFFELSKIPPSICSILSKSGLLTKASREKINQQQLKNETLYNIIMSCIGQQFDKESTWEELGLTSFSSMELRSILSEKYSIDIPPSFMFEYPTPSALNHYIEKTKRPPFKIKDANFDELHQEKVFTSWSVSTALQAIGVVHLLVLFSFSFLPALKFGEWINGTNAANIVLLDVRNWHWIPLIIALWMFSLSVLVFICKWLIIGRYEEKQVPVSSIYFVRYWILDHLLCLWEYLVGWTIRDTPLIILFYKLMGAKISWDSSINSFLRECDLIEVGTGTKLNGDIICHRYLSWKDGEFLRLRRIQIGDHSEVRGIVMLGSSIGNQCMINTTALVCEGVQVPDGTEAKSNPAFNAGSSSLLNYDEADSKRLLFFAIAKSLWLLFELYAYIFFLYIGQKVMKEFRLPQDFRYVLLLRWILVFSISFLISLVFCIFLKWFLIGKKKTGPASSLRKEIADWCVDFHYQTTVLQIKFLCLSSSKFVNVYLMFLGMDIDLKSHIFPMHVAPSQVDLISIRSSFFSSVTFEQPKHENLTIKVDDSNIGKGVIIHGGSRILGAQIQPTSDVRGNVKGSIENSCDRENYFVKEIFGILVCPIVFASLIPSYELFIHDLGNSLGYKMMLLKLVCILFVQRNLSLFIHHSVAIAMDSGNRNQNLPFYQVIAMGWRRHNTSS